MRGRDATAAGSMAADRRKTGGRSQRTSVSSGGRAAVERHQAEASTVSCSPISIECRAQLAPQSLEVPATSRARGDDPHYRPLGHLPPATLVRSDPGGMTITCTARPLTRTTTCSRPRCSNRWSDMSSWLRGTILPSVKAKRFHAPPWRVNALVRYTPDNPPVREIHLREVGPTGEVVLFTTVQLAHLRRQTMSVSSCSTATQVVDFRQAGRNWSPLWML